MKERFHIHTQLRESVQPQVHCSQNYCVTFSVELKHLVRLNILASGIFFLRRTNGILDYDDL